MHLLPLLFHVIVSLTQRPQMYKKLRDHETVQQPWVLNVLRNCNDWLHRWIYISVLKQRVRKELFVGAFSPWRLILLLFLFSCLGANRLPFLACCPKLETKLKLWGLRKFGEHCFCFVMVMLLSSFHQSCHHDHHSAEEVGQHIHCWGIVYLWSIFPVLLFRPETSKESLPLIVPRCSSAKTSTAFNQSDMLFFLLWKRSPELKSSGKEESWNLVKLWEPWTACELWLMLCIRSRGKE